MIKFILKGILRDKSRSLLPIIVVAIGVALTVLFNGYIAGAMGDIVDQNARFDAGHVKVVTRAYAENINQIPNDLAILDADELTDSLQQEFPNFQWTQRIKFGGIFDVPDTLGETKAQGVGAGIAVDLIQNKSGEIERLRIEEALIEGSVPNAPKQMLMGKGLVEKLGIHIGDTITFFGTTMDGSMTFYNFALHGILNFGSKSLDNNMTLVDLADARVMLDMFDATGEILGFDKSEQYEDAIAIAEAQKFNAQYAENESEYAPEMIPLSEQGNMGFYLQMSSAYGFIIVFIFVLAMSLVLWNTGLLGGLRRYQEFGIRLAIGEPKVDIYKRLIYESLLIGIVGSVIGVLIGSGLTLYLQVVGLDVSDMLGDTSGNMIMSNVIRAKLTINAVLIGFIPGVLATLIGAMLSGIGVFKREPSTLFNELSV